MATYLRNIVIECPDPESLAGFYRELLGMRTLRRPPDWMVIGREGEWPRLAFDEVTDYRRPTWPDPTQPQQLHLDIGCSDPDATAALAIELGATELPRLGDCPTYADPAGHPFCLFGDEVCQATGRAVDIAAVCFDCFSPVDASTLADFYAELVDMGVRKADSQGWALIAKADGTRPMLAFQGADGAPPRWPDPAYPQQMHLDIGIEGDVTSSSDLTVEVAKRLGARRLEDLGGSCPVYADPAGHPFCLCRPGE